jgi:hypothetical protein
VYIPEVSELKSIQELEHRFANAGFANTEEKIRYIPLPQRCGELRVIPDKNLQKSPTEQLPISISALVYE